MERDSDHRLSGGASSRGLRPAMICGLLGGLAWIATDVLHGSTALEQALHWGGGALITVALVVIGLLMVKSDVFLLRLFVAVALPVLVWGVFGILRDSRGDDGPLDAVFGVVVGLGSALILARRSRASGATLDLALPLPVTLRGMTGRRVRLDAGGAQCEPRRARGRGEG